MELRWQYNFEVSAMHAAWCVASGRKLLDARLGEWLHEPAVELSQLATSQQIPLTLFWRALIALSVDQPANHDLADRLLKRLVGQGSKPATVSQLASQIGECEAAMRQCYPRLAEEMQLRIGPLQLAWEARGPGLLGMVRRMTGETFLVESATVLPVQPVVAGSGMAHLQTNRVHIEAVLTDIEPRLPETLRLAWLLGQLNLDLPIFTENVHGHSLAELAELALIPVVLQAAEHVQLADCNEQTFGMALGMWLNLDQAAIDSKLPVLSAWWETVAASDWDWSTSLTALAQMQ